ncbi:MAG: hypothetical protein JO316_01120 [Abitibacteriaceae bacterium]|nr:hypothetical protein [Abditibacteriaceae bacterium]
MNKLQLAMLALLVPTSCAKADELNENIEGKPALVKISKTVEVTYQKGKAAVFNNVICNFSITSGQSDNPPSVILAGIVVDNNAGMRQEFVPIFFGSTLHHPLLAALTNVAGEFRFRVCLSNEPYYERYNGSGRLQAIDMNHAALYLGGQFNGKAEMLSSDSYIYLPGEFLKQSAKQKDEPHKEETQKDEPQK